jgi:hypothetical protein
MTCCGAVEEQSAFSFVSGERCRSLELRPGLAQTSELGEEVAAHARQEVVVLERGLRGERIHELEARSRARRHPDCDRTVQLHDRRWYQLDELVIELGNTRPVRL